MRWFPAGLSSFEPGCGHDGCCTNCGLPWIRFMNPRSETVGVSSVGLGFTGPCSKHPNTESAGRSLLHTSALPSSPATVVQGLAFWGFGFLLRPSLIRKRIVWGPTLYFRGGLWSLEHPLAASLVGSSHAIWPSWPVR